MKPQEWSATAKSGVNPLSLQNNTFPTHFNAQNISQKRYIVNTLFQNFQARPKERRNVAILFSAEDAKNSSRQVDSDERRLAIHFNTSKNNAMRSAMITLWVFLEKQGVAPTNNRAERTLRAGVLWRKRSKGIQSDKGDRWIERILALMQTCRMRSIPTFPILVKAIDPFFK